MNSTSDAVHVWPIIVMFVGVLVVAAATIGELGGPRLLRGSRNVVLAAFGVALILAGAFLLRGGG